MKLCTFSYINCERSELSGLFNGMDFLSHSTVVLCTGVLKISLAGANNSVPTTGLTPCIIIVHVYTCNCIIIVHVYNYSGAEKNIDARWHSLAP